MGLNVGDLVVCVVVSCVSVCSLAFVSLEISDNWNKISVEDWARFGIF